MNAQKLKTEYIEDTSLTMSFLTNITGVLISGIVAGWLLGLDRFASASCFAFGYFIYLAVRYAKDDKEARELDIDSANAVAEQAAERANKMDAVAVEAVRLVGEWRAKAIAMQTESERLGTECERLRASERTLTDKVRTLNEAGANADALLANASQALERAQANAQAIKANAEANARKHYTPAVEVAKNYLEYAIAKGIVNNGTKSDTDRAEARERLNNAKALLDAYVVNNKT